MQSRLTHIEVLRGLAALAVTWFHMTNGHATAWARGLGEYGWLGVDCFFVISGFVIPYALHKGGYDLAGFPRFLARRLIRLEPPYLVSIALVVVLAWVSAMAPGFRGEPAHYTVPQLASHLLYLVPLFKTDWINVVYWSLAYEFAFYIAAGLSFPMLFRRPIWWTAALVTVIALAVPGKTSFLDPRVMLFLVGIAAMRFYVGRDRLPVFLACILGACILIAAAGAPANAIAGGATALVLALVKLPAPRALTALGGMSYSLYLTHVPIGGRVVNLGRRFGEGGLYELALSLVALVVSLVFAWVFCKLFEAPATALAHRLSIRNQQRRTGEAVAADPAA
jgi:peptidoglycan/LPS O-acetylase OafA/YrhL